MVSIHPLISKSTSPCTNPLVTTKSTNRNCYHSILADFNNADVWMVSTRPLISKPPVPVPILYANTHVSQFFQFPSKVLVLIFLFAFFQFYSVVSQGGKVHNSLGSLCCWLSLGRVVTPRLDDSFVSQYRRGICESHSPGQLLCCAYVRMVIFKLHTQFSVDHPPHQVMSSLVLFLR